MEQTLEEVVAVTGITVRNIKYWSALYKLPVRREGRRNFYPPQTVSLLGAIAKIAGLQIYTTLYVRWLVDLALDREPAEPARYRALVASYPRIAATLGAALPRRPGVVDPVPELPTDPSTAALHRSRRNRDDDALL